MFYYIIIVIIIIIIVIIIIVIVIIVVVVIVIVFVINCFCPGSSLFGLSHSLNHSQCLFKKMNKLWRLYRGYYTVARRYVRVARTISHE